MGDFFELVSSLESSIDKLDRILLGSDDQTVSIEGIEKSTISKAIKDRFAALEALANGRHPFQTKAALIADNTIAKDGSVLAEVWNDGANNGVYGYKSGAWSRSEYSLYNRIDNLPKALPAWASVDVLLNDPVGNFANSTTCTTDPTAAAITAPAGWPLDGKVFKFSSSAGVSDVAFFLLRSASGLTYKLADYADKFLDLQILADTGTLQHTTDSFTDFKSFGLLLRSGSLYPEVKAYFVRKITSNVSEYRTTVAVNDLLALYPAAEIFDLRIKVAEAAVGTVYFGAPRIAFAPTSDRANFDHACSSLTIAHAERLTALELSSEKIAQLENAVNNLQLPTLPTPTIVSNDIPGDSIGLFSALNAASAIAVSPTGWPDEVKKAFKVETVDDGATVTITQLLRKPDGGYYYLDNYRGKYIDLVFLAETTLSLTSDFYRTGLLCVSDQGYPLVQVSLDRVIINGVSQYRATISVDDIIQGHTNCRLESFSPQIKPSAAGEFTVGALRVSIGDSDSVSRYDSAYDKNALTALINANKVQVESNSLRLSALEVDAPPTPQIVVSGNQTTSGVTVDKLSSLVSNTGAKLIQAGSTFPNTLLATPERQIRSSYPAPDFFVKSFLFYGDKFEFRTKEVRSTFDIYADDMPVGTHEFSASSGATRYISVQFADVKLRKINIHCWNAYFGDLTAPVGSAFNPAESSHVRVMVIGDSITEGSGSAKMTDCYASRLRTELGVNDLYISGIGGTGYINDLNGTRRNFNARLADDVTPYAPDILIIAGGINDTASTPAQFQASIDTFYENLVNQLPNAKIIILSPWAPRDISTAVPNIALFGDILKNKAALIGAKFIDVRDFFSGTGRVGNPQGNGNSDIYISSDSTHPSPRGHEYIAKRLGQLLKNTGWF